MDTQRKKRKEKSRGERDRSSTNRSNVAGELLRCESVFYSFSVKVCRHSPGSRFPDLGVVVGALGHAHEAVGVDGRPEVLRQELLRHEVWQVRVRQHQPDLRVLLVPETSGQRRRGAVTTRAARAYGHTDATEHIRPRVSKLSKKNVVECLGEILCMVCASARRQRLSPRRVATGMDQLCSPTGLPTARAPAAYSARAHSER